MVGMKPAGGISTAKSALQYLVMLHETLGNKWMNNQWFRFGASSLANDIILQLGKEQKGVYYSKDLVDFSLAMGQADKVSTTSFIAGKDKCIPLWIAIGMEIYRS